MHTGIAGPLVSPETYDKPDQKLIGSIMVFEAEKLEVAKKMVEADIYFKSNVVSILRVGSSLHFLTC